MRNDHGFTLIEVIIAMTVMLIGMLGVMGMQYYAIAGNASSRELRAATTLSTDMMEQLRGTPYNNMVSGTNAPPVSTTGTAGITFTRTWWVINNCSELRGNGTSCAPGNVPLCLQTPGTTPATEVSAMRVRTCWTDKNGVAHAATMNETRTRIN